MYSPIHVLIVDDNPGDAVLLAERLSEIHDVPITSEAETTLQAALGSLERQKIDVVVLDLGLPDSQGLQTVHRLLAHRPIPTIVVSGFLNDSTRAAALEAGAIEAFEKSEMASRAFALAVLYGVQRDRARAHFHLLEQLLDVTPDAVIVSTAHGEVRFANEAAAALFGVTRETLLSEPIAFAVEPGSTVELRLPPRDGSERVVEMRAAHFMWKDSPATVAVLRDVTEARQRELQLMLSDRMVSLGTLAAGVAHEINNPLTSVVANLSLALHDVKGARGTVSSPALLEGLEDAWLGADRVRRIVGDLKLFSRSEDHDEGPCDPNQVVASTLRMAWNEIRHRAALRQQLEATRSASISESRLGQVVLNLLVNAAQALDDGDIERQLIAVKTADLPDGRVAIEVADNGPGIPAQVQRHIFTPFFTTKAQGVGTGLGLAICRRIVTDVGGELSFTSGPDGTVFEILLPASEAPAIDTTTPITATVRAARPARVLVVDDEELLVATIRRSLEEHEVVGVVDPRRAVELLNKERPFDVILCDVMMPSMTAAAFLEAVSQHDPRQAERVVFLTGGAFSTEARTFLGSTRNLVLNKPFDPARLRAVVATYVETHDRRRAS